MNTERMVVLAFLLILLVQATLADPLTVWHSREPLPTGNTLNGIAYGKGRFIAVGNSGTILASSNGVDWACCPSGVNPDLTAIAFANGRFLVGGKAGLMLYSDDCVSWKTGSVPLAYDVDAIGYGMGTNTPNGVYVAMASTNSQSSSGSSIILISSDGQTWSTNTHFSSGRLQAPCQSITFGADRFVISGIPYSYGPIQAITSTSGTNWGKCFGSTLGPVAFGNGLFVLALDFQQTPNGITLLANTSRDGLFWPGLSYGGWYGPRAECFGGGRFVVVGMHGTSAVSLDGTNWTAQVADSDANWSSVTYGGGLYVTVGTAGLIMRSSDGANWTRCNTGPVGDLYAVVPVDDGFLSLGSGGNLAVSTNGVLWQSLESPTANPLTTALKAGGKCVAAGASGTILSGDSVTNLMARSSGTAAGLSGLAYGGGTFVAVGDAGAILTSPDSVTWSLQNSGVTNNLVDVVYGNGEFIAVGYSGVILTSTDSKTWGLQGSGTTCQFKHIAFGGGHFVAVSLPHTGSGPLVVTSDDGVAWQPPTGPFFVPGGALAYGGGIFLSSSQSPASLFSSSDGQKWTARYSSQAYLTSLAYNNHTFVSVGRYGTIYQSDPFVSVTVQWDGLAYLTIDGPTGAYRIEASDCRWAADGWLTLTNLSVPGGAWVDPQSANASNRVYRAALLQ